MGFLDRLREPSTWAGIGVVAAGAGQVAEVGAGAAASGASEWGIGLAMLSALASIFMKEKSR